MTKLDIKRRAILKGMSALGAGGFLVACSGGGDSSSSPTSSGSTNSNGNTIDPTNNSKGPSAPSCSTNSSASIPIIIDASVLATGIPQNVPMYAYISGKQSVANIQYLYDPAQKKPVQANSLTNANQYAGPGMLANSPAATIHYAEAWTNIAIPLDRTCATLIADLASFNSTNISGLASPAPNFSGRIWISVGEPLLPFTPLADPTQVTFPAFDNTYGSFAFYDWIEFSWDATGDLFLNTTQVDQYGFSISAKATGSTVSNPEIGIYNQPRSTILSTLKSIGNQNPVFGTPIPIPTTQGISPTAYPPSANTSGTIRMLSPKQWVATQTSTYLDSYISNMLTFWSTNWVAVSCPGSGTYYGLASGSTLNFYTSKTSGAVAFSFSTAVGGGLSTNNILACNGAIALGSADQKNIGKALAAGFNRGVFTNAGGGTTVINIDQSNNNANFTPPLSSDYKVNPQYNTWAYNFHKFSSDGYAYGFPYDDVGNDEDLTQVTSTTGITIQLGIFN